MCLCEAEEGAIQLEDFRVQPMPGSGLCSALLPLSALVPSPGMSGTEGEECQPHRVAVATWYMLELALHTHNSLTADATNLR